MGYCMNQISSKFAISMKNRANVLAAIKALAGKETIKDAGGRHFSWVDENFATRTNLADIILDWRWEIKDREICDGEGNVIGHDVVSIHFAGEKYGDDDILFQAIAPFVEKGSFIEMQGEDGERWRWVFDGKTCTQKKVKISY